MCVFWRTVPLRIELKTEHLHLGTERLSLRTKLSSNSTNKGEYVASFFFQQLRTETEEHSIDIDMHAKHKMAKSLSLRTMALLIQKQSAYSQSLTFTDWICAVHNTLLHIKGKGALRFIMMHSESGKRKSIKKSHVLFQMLKHLELF